MQNKRRIIGQKSSIDNLLHELRHFLPSQGPIKDFVHHNTIHVFQDAGLAFHEAVRQASRLYGAREYLPLAEYRRAYQVKDISEAALDYVLAQQKVNKHTLKQLMLHGSFAEVAQRPGFRAAGYLQAMTAQTGLKIEERIHPLIFRLVANYLDQGIASISMSEYANNFWHALRQQFTAARPSRISKRVAKIICTCEPEAVINDALQKILPAAADQKVFLLEVLMAARGWPGIIAQIEDNPQALIYPRHIKLVQYVALYLVLLHEILDATGYKRDDLPVQNPNTLFFLEHFPTESEVEMVSRLWQEAMEMSFYFESLLAVNAQAHTKRGRFSRERSVKYQAVFCIDDRESSVRRHLEECSASIETFATPGFFAIDAVYQGPFDKIPTKQCPVPMTPQHRIRGVLKGRRKLSRSRLEMNFWHRHANSLALGWIVSQFFGWLSLIRMAFAVHFPSRSFATASSTSNLDDATDLHYERPVGETKQDDFYEGYTVAEMAERVTRVLRQIGLSKNFASLVAIVGHGSSSTNNPYFAAYDCGACAGRSALINARVFALMANRRDVRALVHNAGIAIPETTSFIGAIHDTARDKIVFLDEGLLPSSLQTNLADLKQLFKIALQNNAQERVRRFANVEVPNLPSKAVREVRLRTEMLFEPRPEYNHATNALAIVGRRSLTENIFFDRRVFYNSYSPEQDKDGKILDGILTPLVPVCAGINLEYLFSRTDNVVYGAGSKLPHNIFALIGVGNGVDGDLRTGLPEQMIEIHDPLRMLLIVEQKHAIAEKVLNNNANVMQWIEKDWIKMCIYDYVLGKYFWYSHGKFVELELPKTKIEIFPDSQTVYYNQRENIAPAIIRRAN